MQVSLHFNCWAAGREGDMALFDVVFEGGGAKGSAFVGALQVLKEQGHQTRRLVGTSAGAITAALLAAGYSPEEMLAAVNEKLGGKPRFASFMDTPHAADFTEAQKEDSETMRALHAAHLPELVREAAIKALLASPVYPQLFSFVECGGVFAGAKFVEWLVEKLAAKDVAATDTLASMFAKKHVDLTLVASDTTDVEMLMLNHRTAPAVPVVWAVRMSMSIPFLWREVEWQDAWGLYRGGRKTANTVVDGGVLSNFPIRLIAEPVPEIMGDTDPAAALNLGLMLDERLPVPGMDATVPPKPLEQLRVVQRVSRLIDTMMGAEDNDEVRSRADEICRLPVRGYSTTEFDMPQTKLEALVAGGRASTLAHLRQRRLA
jgi:predicted acylesterase/phospholipase RssA